MLIKKNNLYSHRGCGLLFKNKIWADKCEERYGKDGGYNSEITKYSMKGGV